MLRWIIAAVCAYFVKGLCGFANTLVFTTVLSFGNSNVSISPVELVLGFPSNTIMMWRERQSVRWRVCLPLIALVIIGSIPGALFLKNADTGVVRLIFGAVIVVMGVEMLLRELNSRKAKHSKAALAVIGILSGLLCGLYGIGALLGAYISRVTDDSRSFRANICTVFLADNIFRLILYSVWGILTADILRQAVILVPFMLLGLVLGILSRKLLNETVVKRIVTCMLILSGIALIAGNL